MKRVTKSLNICLGLAAAVLVCGEPARGFDLAEMEVGKEPEGVFVLEGAFTVEEIDGHRVVMMGATPVEECMMLFGDTLRGPATVRGRVKGEKKGRSYPSFGMGLYGVSGYRLRVVPARKVVELVHGDEVIAEADFAWSGAGWTWMELATSVGEGGQWLIEGRVWEDGTERPEKSQLGHVVKASGVMGKAGILGTPYSGQPTFFGELQVEDGAK